MSEQSHALAALRESLEGFEQRVDTRFNALDDKISAQFLWIVGIQIAILVAVLAATLSRG